MVITGYFMPVGIRKNWHFLILCDYNTTLPSFPLAYPHVLDHVHVPPSPPSSPSPPSPPHPQLHCICHIHHVCHIHQVQHVNHAYRAHLAYSAADEQHLVWVQWHMDGLDGYSMQLGPHHWDASLSSVSAWAQAVAAVALLWQLQKYLITVAFIANLVKSRVMNQMMFCPRCIRTSRINE